MKRRYYVMLKKLIGTSVLIGGSDYELSICVKQQKDAKFIKVEHTKPVDVVSVQCVFLEKKTQKSLLVFTAERWFCSIKKTNVHEDVYENHLANVSSVERKDEKENFCSIEAESNWWITLNEFISAVHYVVKMKNGLKEIRNRSVRFAV